MISTDIYQKAHTYFLPKLIPFRAQERLINRSAPILSIVRSSGKIRLLFNSCFQTSTEGKVVYGCRHSSGRGRAILLIFLNTAIPWTLLGRDEKTNYLFFIFSQKKGRLLFHWFQWKSCFFDQINDGNVTSESGTSVLFANFMLIFSPVTSPAIN